MFIDIGLLFLRVCFGSMMLLGHGLSKLGKISTLMETFPDPIGVGSKVSAILAVSAEVGASALVIAGLATRIACVPLLFTMLVAFGVIHANDPWNKKELAFLYCLIFTSIAIMGPGRFSLDGLRGKA